MKEAEEACKTIGSREGTSQYEEEYQLSKNCLQCKETFSGEKKITRDHSYFKIG